MRIFCLLTVAALLSARDSAQAQDFALSAQAIPLVTRAAPTAGHATLTEGYLTQPMIMAHGDWSWLRAAATIDFEGLTIDRGELSTGGYGEGYIDRRHPHSYVHEGLLGAEGTRGGWRASLFAGRGFAPFGSDDPMVRPFEKYPVNHHLAQVLERIVTIAAVRRGPLLAEVGVFNGDEPVSPGSSSSLRRFGDSWSSRVTLYPVSDVELSASWAKVKSPEVRTGEGLDQTKSSLVARFDRESESRRLYGMLEYAHTNESDPEEVTTRLSSLLGETAYCRAGVIGALRLERTDRPEEEQLLDPFRTPRPAVDLANLGVSRWTVVTGSLSAPVAQVGPIGARPFVEVARLAVSARNSAGIFNPQFRYGSSRMWMLSAGIRLRAGTMHDRMGRYGAAAPSMESMGMGTHGGDQESDMMPGMTHAAMPGMSSPASHHSSTNRCSP